MSRMANPTKTQQVAERLARYYEDEPVEVIVRSLPRQGLFIYVNHLESPDGGLFFHVDQLDNGASGFRDDALRKIRAYIDGVEYVPIPVKPGLRYDDIMTYGDIPNE